MDNSGYFGNTRSSAQPLWKSSLRQPSVFVKYGHGNNREVNRQFTGHEARLKQLELYMKKQTRKKKMVRTNQSLRLQNDNKKESNAEELELKSMNTTLNLTKVEATRPIIREEITTPTLKSIVVKPKVTSTQEISKQINQTINSTQKLFKLMEIQENSNLIIQPEIESLDTEIDSISNQTNSSKTENNLKNFNRLRSRLDRYKRETSFKNFLGINNRKYLKFYRRNATKARLLHIKERLIELGFPILKRFYNPDLKNNHI